MRKDFKKELETGALEYRVVNVETPQNRHFIKDFGLYTKSHVICEVKGEKVVRYKVLQKVWQYVRDPERARIYLRDAIREFMKKGARS